MLIPPTTGTVRFSVNSAIRAAWTGTYLYLFRGNSTVSAEWPLVRKADSTAIYL
jgi:hypothetical protein